MISETLVRHDNLVPRGFAEAFETSAFTRIERRYSSHRERLTEPFFDTVCINLRDGKVKRFPLNYKSLVYFFGIRFSFEGHTFKVLLPAPGIPDPRVIICAKEVLAPDVILRAAEYFTHDFVVEYKRFYSSSIRASKKKNGVT